MTSIYESVKSVADKLKINWSLDPGLECLDVGTIIKVLGASTVEVQECRKWKTEFEQSPTRALAEWENEIHNLRQKYEAEFNNAISVWKERYAGVTTGMVEKLSTRQFGLWSLGEISRRVKREGLQIYEATTQGTTQESPRSLSLARHVQQIKFIEKS